jgi:hypothetical protein
LARSDGSQDFKKGTAAKPAPTTPTAPVLSNKVRRLLLTLSVIDLTPNE